jgi:tRNA-guanine transglycosylase
MKFIINHKNKKERVGVLETAHGKIQTPNLAIVATHGKVRLLNKSDHKKAKLELIIANTFHLWVNRAKSGVSPSSPSLPAGEAGLRRASKVSEIKKAGGIHKWNKFNIPTMTDSGGFQVFSLGWGKLHDIGKVAKKEISGKNKINDKTEKNPVIITDEGVKFEYDNKPFKLTPEKSMKIQWDIGADIIFAFDECTSPLHSHAYTKKSLERTHAWAEKSLKAHNKLDKNNEQFLFGIVQGGVFENLRKKSSKFIGSLPFDGFGIGGSFGEKQMKEVLGWALNGLPEEKPRHLLGIGRIKDIFEGVEQGIDLFDCVIPTREARHGVLYTKQGRIDFKKSVWKNSRKIIDKNCDCPACGDKLTFGEINQLFKNDSQKDKLKAQRLATIHNIHFYKTLFQEIRAALATGKTLKQLKKEYSAFV